MYGAGHFEKDALEILNELFKIHSIVFVVGGSGLYIDALINGVDDFVDVPLDVRETLNKNYLEFGLAWLQNEIKTKDKDYFALVDINNSQRLLRALEVIEHTGLTYSGFLKKNKQFRNFTPIKILINKNREDLYDTINKRVDTMMKEGLFNEVKQFMAYKDFNALKTVGYKELYDHLEGKLTLEEAVEKIKQHTRNYAKRQLTWFKNKDQFEEFGPLDFEKIRAYIDIIVAHG